MGVQISADKQLEAFIGKYEERIAAQAREALKTLRRLLPGATELVYDNYNALAIGFATGDRGSDVIVSLTLYPRWISLFFTQAAGLDDPDGLLEGSGSQIRHVRLGSVPPSDARVHDLLRRAAAARGAMFDGSQPRHAIIKSISAKQRPRRPRGENDGTR
ncbi:MAG TPA: hypothetical protein VF614_01980 [Chthoniobacteraceae bacterium]|jgi:hypothetical protein